VIDRTRVQVFAGADVAPDPFGEERFADPVAARLPHDDLVLD
jgi:hypothetical protein